MTRHAPPAGGQQQRAARGLDVLGRFTPDHPAGILAELVLLDVGAAEDNVADRIEQHDSDRSPPWQIVGVLDEIIRLDGVRERHPHEVAPAQHPAEVLVLDVPRREDRFLVEVVVGDVPEVEAQTRIIGTVTNPCNSYCLAASERSITTQPMRPGRASQNSFKSKLAIARVKRRAEPEIVHRVVGDSLILHAEALAVPIQVATRREK